MKRKVVIFYLVIATLLIFELLFLSSEFRTEVFTIIFLESQVLFLLFSLIISGRYIMRHAWSDVYFLFLFTFTLFLLSRVFLDLFGLFDLQVGTFLASGLIFSYAETAELLIYLSLFLCFFQIGAICFSCQKINTKVTIKKSYPYEKLGLILFFLGLPGNYITVSTIYEYSLTHSYIDLYTSTKASFGIPWYATGSATICLIGYMFFVASIPSKRKFIFISSIYFIIWLFTLLAGSRGAPIVYLLYCTWYYYTFISTDKLRKRYMLFMGGAGVLLLQFIALSREKTDIVAISLSKVFAQFFSDQGTSLLIFQVMIKYKNELLSTELPYIITSSIRPILNYIPELGSNLGGKMNDILFAYPGASLGSSFIGELYDLGIIGFVVMSFVFGVFIEWYPRVCTYNRVALFMSMIFIRNMIWMPRGSYSPNLTEILFPLVVLILFQFILKKNKKNKKNSEVQIPNYL